MAVMMHRDAPVLINRLSRLMGERRVTQEALCRATGLSRQTVNDLYHARSSRLDLATLDKLCAYFRVGPSDIFEWRPDAPGDPALEGEC